MKVLNHLNDFPADIQSVVSIGTFDGVHKGHQQIIRELKKQTNSGCQSVVLTFWPHPKKILSSQAAPKLLSTLDERIQLLEKEGVDYVLVLPFTKELSELSALAFVEEILVKKLHLHTIVMGYDHKFGNDRKGDLPFLKSLSTTLHFNVVEIPAQLIEETAVSSTQIRKALNHHNIQEASLLLGHYYSIRGEVVSGRKLGRTIGYPTANIELDHADKLIPAKGIYAVWAEGSFGIRPAMMSIGDNPTIEGAKFSIEVHIFDFNADLYTQHLRVYFVEYLRKEVKFDGLDALTTQLKQDEMNARNILLNHPQP